MVEQEDSSQVDTEGHRDTEILEEVSCVPKKKRRRRRKPRLTGLSKQRQTANARERIRMRSISEALLHLRYHLPQTVVPKDKKLSKIQTLRLAIRYISDLWQVVQGEDGHMLDSDSGNESPHHLSIIKELKDTESMSPNSEGSSSSSSSGTSGKQEDFDDGFRSDTDGESSEYCCEMLA